MKDFKEQKERYEVFINRNVKDKRAMVFMHDEQRRKHEKTDRVIEIIHGFIIQIANCVNNLRKAEEIDIKLYA